MLSSNSILLAGETEQICFTARKNIPAWWSFEIYIYYLTVPGIVQQLRDMIKDSAPSICLLCCFELSLFVCFLSWLQKGCWSSENRSVFRIRRVMGHSLRLSLWLESTVAFSQAPPNRFLFECHWPKLCHMTIPCCKAGWGSEHLVGRRVASGAGLSQSSVFTWRWSHGHPKKKRGST